MNKRIVICGDAGLISKRLIKLCLNGIQVTPIGSSEAFAAIKSGTTPEMRIEAPRELDIFIDDLEPKKQPKHKPFHNYERFQNSFNRKHKK